MESPRGKVRIEVDAGTDLGRKIITLKPKDIQITETLISKINDEQLQLVFCYGMVHPYRVEGTTLEKLDAIILKAEQEVKEDGQ